jgi:hypothetical protein
MATYDYKELLEQTYPRQPNRQQKLNTRYARTLSEFSNQVDLTQQFPLEEGLVVLAEARSTSGISLATYPANEYRFAINNFVIDIDAAYGNISITNQALNNTLTNTITGIKCLYNHIEFLSKLMDYETMHFDVYTKGQFRISVELTQLLIEIINKINQGGFFPNSSYSNAGLETQITQEPPNNTSKLIFNDLLYTV